MRSVFVIATCLLLGAEARATNLLTNPGFEALETTSGGFPHSAGDWGGNYSQIVAAQNGIMPAEGQRMLRFLGTTDNGNSHITFGSTIVQIYAGPEVVPGAVFTATALYNRVNSSPLIDTEFDINIRAYSGTPASFLLNGQIADSVGIILSDDDPQTWEMATTSLTLPAATTYIAVLVVATENILDDADGPEFYGHYADSVSLVVPEPSSLTFVGMGCLALLRRRRRAWTNNHPNIGLSKNARMAGHVTQILPPTP